MATQPIEQPDVPDAVSAAEPPQDTRDYAAEARLMGWKPEEEFGDGDKRPRAFKDAETFVKDAEEKAGLQKQTIHHQKEKIAFLERQVRRLIQSEQNAHALAMEEVRREMRAAVESGDVQAFEALDKKADTIRRDMQADTQTHGEDPAEHVLAFRESNPWYDKGALASASEIEIEARLFADRTADRWIAQGKPKTMPPSQFYAELAEEVNERFPMLKHKPARTKPQSDVAPSTRPAPRASAQTGANLPADAKATAERYMRQKIPGYSSCKSKQEAYDLFAKSYTWE